MISLIAIECLKFVSSAQKDYFGGENLLTFFRKNLHKINFF